MRNYQKIMTRMITLCGYIFWRQNWQDLLIAWLWSEKKEWGCLENFGLKNIMSDKATYWVWENCRQNKSNSLEEGRIGLEYVKFQVPIRHPREDIEQQLNFKSEIPGGCWGKWDIVYSLSSAEGINKECWKGWANKIEQKSGYVFRSLERRSETEIETEKQ